MKIYKVNIDMKYSKSIVVSSKSKAEAKKKAWEKFIKRVPKRIFEVDVEYETY